ncbi:MAG: type II toxin-antitoxin system HigB family toxin [Spartobacteria bacterium]|nr:type II toxin-antitoxin system HigB family toxin [Spartobacteria bacterium]
MHVISRKKLRDFWAGHADAEEQLKAWFHEAKTASWASSVELKKKYGKASIINAERVVFNICGNKYRLVVRINYTSGAVFVRFVGTHRQYDKIDVETI